MFGEQLKNQRKDFFGLEKILQNAKKRVFKSSLQEFSFQKRVL